MAAQPLVGGGSTDAQRLGGAGHRPALVVDPAHQQLSTEDVETCPRMGHESLLTVWSVDTTNRAWRLSSVNNVLGKYT
jgi:hypothetical protein